MATRKYPEPPLESPDPVDWLMHSDMLQDMGASRSLWQRSLRVAASLEKSPDLIVMATWMLQAYLPNRVPPLLSACLQRVAHAWMGPTWPAVDRELAHLVRRVAGARHEIEMWVGTPWKSASPQMRKLLERAPRRKVLLSFFHVHAHTSDPNYRVHF